MKLYLFMKGGVYKQKIKQKIIKNIIKREVEKMKTKTSLKSFVALGIMLLSVFILNVNTANAAEVDETYVKNLKLTSPKYYEVDLDYLPYNSEDESTWNSVYQKFHKTIGDYYTKQINNKAITVKASSMAGGTDEGLNLWTWERGTELSIYLNGNLCDKREMGQEFTVPVINVPSSVKDSELNNYLKEIITKANTAFGEKITSITKGATVKNSSISNPYEIEIPNGYTIKSDYGMESAVIVRKEKVTEPVKKEETTTKIKLEADTTVIPEDTVLNTKEIKEEKTLKTVKESLKEVSTKYITYDITLTSNNAKIQPNGKVKISIPIPTGFDTTKLVVYRISEDGTKTKYDVNIAGEYATFETDHFSTYVLAENNVVTNTSNTENTNNTTDTETNTETTKTNKGEKDDTPKTGNINIVGYVLVLAMLSGVGIITLNKKSK